MTEETAQAEQQPAPEATPAPTLESLYEEYNVKTPEPEPAATITSTEPQPGGSDDVAAIHNEVTAVRQELAADRERRAREADEKDLNKAVATLGEAAEVKGKDLMLRGYLIAKASEDQRLRALWMKRGDNPAAWAKALKIMATEVAQEFQVPNPQIEENQRAMEESQRTASGRAPPPETRESKLMQMNASEFQQAWRGLARRG